MKKFKVKVQYTSHGYAYVDAENEAAAKDAIAEFTDDDFDWEDEDETAEIEFISAEEAE